MAILRKCIGCHTQKPETEFLFKNNGRLMKNCEECYRKTPWGKKIGFGPGAARKKMHEKREAKFSERRR